MKGHHSHCVTDVGRFFFFSSSCSYVFILTFPSCFICVNANFCLKTTFWKVQATFQFNNVQKNDNISNTMGRNNRHDAIPEMMTLPVDLLIKWLSSPSQTRQTVTCNCYMCWDNGRAITSLEGHSEKTVNQSLHLKDRFGLIAQKPPAFCWDMCKFSAFIWKE